MKKSLLALAVFGAFAGVAHAQSSVTIYGIIDTNITYENRAAGTTGVSGSKFQVASGSSNIQGSRLGFKGAEDLGGGLSAVFALEAGFYSDTGALSNANGGSPTLFRRKSYVGFASNTAGTVLVGRQTDWNDTISAYTAVHDFGGFVGNSGANLDRLQGTRTNNSISYTSPTIAGFTGTALYGFGEQAGQTSDGQAFSFGGSYVNGPLALGATYYQSKVGATNANTADTSLTSTTTTTPIYSAGNAGSTAQKVFTLVGSYQVGAARVYANWSQVKQPLNVQGTVINGGTTSTFTSLATSTTSLTTNSSATLGNAKKVNAYELGTAYSLSAALKLLAAVDYASAQFDGVGTNGKVTQLSLGTDYNLSQRTDVYAFLGYIHSSNMYNPGVVDATGGGTNQTAVAIGVRHKF